jgi:monofunctional biosynthetic peptidoglycan transglycosylase
MIKWIVLFFFGSTILSVFIYRYIPVYFTPLMFIRCFEQVGRGEEIRLKHHWVDINEISPFLPVAVIASEDQLFMEHYGFDMASIRDAIKEREMGKRKRGASTISQQTAKNVFLWPSSTWFRKGMEAYFTVLIEIFWGKERIMEVYLNSIEMGDGIYGAEAVAQQHFGREARILSRANCAMIAATLPNPLQLNSQAPTPYLLKRQTAIIKQMKNVEHTWQNKKTKEPHIRMSKK